MVVLPNIYASDIKTLVTWWKEIKDIDAVYQEDVWNLMQRFEKDLHDFSQGAVKTF